jgi:hypothetical protein
MNGLLPFRARSFEIGCTVRVSHTFESLFAHVELDGNVPIFPGDRVRVHGTDINPPYGSVCVERRMATVTHAGFLERTWTRLTGDLDCLSLLDVSFTDRRTL